MADDRREPAADAEEAWPDDIAAKAYGQALQAFDDARAFVEATDVGDPRRLRIALQGVAAVCEVVKAAANAYRVTTS